jgi:hypothetical protein
MDTVLNTVHRSFNIHQGIEGYHGQRQMRRSSRRLVLKNSREFWFTLSSPDCEGREVVGLVTLIYHIIPHIKLITIVKVKL